jgi:archaemetzincin
MKKTILLLSALLLLTSFCDSPPKVVNIQPLGKVSPKYIEQVKKSVKRFYGYECVVRPRKEVEEWMLSEKRRRIEAERTIRKYNTSENLMFITERDICHRKDSKNPEYGIFGLGLKSENTCIVSTFRLRRKGEKKTLERLEKVALHEIGHNLGLNHCESKRCMMNDAKGTIKQVDLAKVWLCEKCLDKI